MTSYVSSTLTLTLTFINAVHGWIFKFRSRIAIVANIDIGIAPETIRDTTKRLKTSQRAVTSSTKWH